MAKKNEKGTDGLNFEKPLEELDQLLLKIKELSAEYLKLTGKPAALFESDSVPKATAAVGTLKKAISEAKREATSLEEGFGGIDRAVKGIVAELKKGNSESAIATRAFKGIQDITQKLKYDQQGISNLNSKQLTQLQEKLGQNQQEIRDQAKIIESKYKEKGLDATKLTLNDKGKELGEKKLKERALGLGLTVQELKNEQAIALAAKEGFAIFGEINDELEKRIQKEKSIEKTMGLTGKLMKGISKIPIVGQFTNSEEALEKMRDHAGEVDKKGNLINGKFSTMAVGVKEVGKQIIKGIFDPLTMVIALIKAGLTFDTQVVELQKSMGMSRVEAEGLRHKMSGAAAASGDMAINSERMLKTFSMLQSQLGVAANFSTKMTEDATVLSEKVGLSDEATAGFAKSSLVVGKSIDTQYKNSLGIVGSIRAATGVAVPFKETLEKAGKVSGQIRAQMGGSLEEITKAVATASALGMELEQVASSGKSMLDFQSSIESELEAELLTGKQLNLEKARLLALTGDLKGLSKEIAKEAGSFSEFNKMNVLQQDALAKSFGMQADEMSNMLMDQEMMGKTKEQLIASGKGDLAKIMEERDVNKQMADAVMKLKTVFVDLVGGPVGDFLNLLTMALTPIADMLTGLKAIFNIFGESKGPLTKMQAILGAIAAVYIAIKGTMLIIKGIQIAKNTLAGISLAYKLRSVSLERIQAQLSRKGLGGGVAKASAAIFKGMAGMGPAGIIAAILAIAGMAALVYSQAAKAEKGGMIGGNRHSQGGTIIEAEQGEFIMSRQGVQSVGVDNLYAMNRGGGISGGKAQAGGVVQSTSGQSNSGMNMQSFTDAVISAVNNTKPGVVIASPYGLNNTNYQSRNENFKTKFE
jgi:hypothetical protein